MDHVAIMRKSWGLTGKVLNGSKAIESRWYKTKRSPWDRVSNGDSIYFKDSGEPVTIRARVCRVLQFSDLTSDDVSKIIRRYGRKDGISPKDTKTFFNRFKDSRYCTLIFFRNPMKVRPFGIDKSGFGAMSAWITVDNIRNIRVK